MDYRLPQGRNLLEHLDLEGGGPYTTTRLRSMEGIVLGDGNGEASVENHRHRLPDHIHEAYAAVIPSPFKYQDHRLPGRFLHKESISESQMH